MSRNANQKIDLRHREFESSPPAAPNRLPVSPYMTVTDSVPERALSEIWRFLSRFVGGWICALRRRLRVRRSIQALEALDDRTLDDIGVPRAKIRSIVLSEAIRDEWT